MFMLLDYNLGDEMAVIDTNDGVVEVLTSRFVKGIADNRPDIYISGLEKKASKKGYSVQRMPLPFEPYKGSLPVTVISCLDITKNRERVTCRISGYGYNGEDNLSHKKNFSLDLINRENSVDLAISPFFLANNTDIWYENIQDGTSFRTRGRKARYKFGDEFPYFEELFPNLSLGDFVWKILQKGYIPMNVNK